MHRTNHRFVPLVAYPLCLLALALVVILTGSVPGHCGKPPPVKYLPPAINVVVVGFPARILQRARDRYYPVEMVTGSGLETLGFDPAKIDQIMVIVRLPKDFENPQQSEPQVAAVLCFGKPINRQTILAKTEETGKRLVQGVESWPMPSFQNETRVCFPDDQTILLGSEDSLAEMLAASQETHDRSSEPYRQFLKQRLLNADPKADARMILHVEPIRKRLHQAANRMMELQRLKSEVPEGAERLTEAIDLTRSLELSLKRTDDEEIFGIDFVADDPQRVGKIKELLELYQNVVGESLQQQLIKNRPPNPTPVDLAIEAYRKRLQKAYLALPKTTRQGNTLSVRIEVTGQTTPVFVASTLLAAAVQQVRAQAQRAVAANHLRMLLLAMLNHASNRNGLLPGDIRDPKTGQPLLSWRVRVLPYLEEQALYDRFKLDEPWDSEHNKTLLRRMPSAFRSPTSKLDPDSPLTSMLRPTGKGLINDPQRKPAHLDKIPDGSRHTVLLVEASDEVAVPWTKPADLPIDPKNPKRGLGGMHVGGFFVGFANVRLSFLQDDIEAEVLYRLFTAAGGEEIPETSW